MFIVNPSVNPKLTVKYMAKFGAALHNNVHYGVSGTIQVRVWKLTWDNLSRPIIFEIRRILECL